MGFGPKSGSDGLPPGRVLGVGVSPVQDRAWSEETDADPKRIRRM